MRRYIIFILCLVVYLIFLVKKEKFNNYSYIPDFSIYQYADKLYKLDDKNTKDFYNSINKSQINNEYLIDKIILKKYKKREDIINIKKECNKKKSYKNFNYLNCKNKCNFIEVSSKDKCIKDCDYLNDFNSDKCFNNLHYKHYIIN